MLNTKTRFTYFDYQIDFVNQIPTHMITKNESTDNEIYQPMFLDYEKLGVDQLFPDVPYSSNPLLDIYKRMKQLHTYIRKTFQAKFNWTLVRFYRKMNDSSDRFDIIYSELKFNERRMVIATTIDCLQAFIDYLKKEYINEL
jgi:hypothetical protein